MSLSPRDLNLFVLELVAARRRWEHLVRHADDARVYEQIWDDEHVNAWVICWSEDQDTGFHDHDLSAAAIAVISGQVREDRLRLGATPAQQGDRRRTKLQRAAGGDPPGDAQRRPRRRSRSMHTPRHSLAPGSTASVPAASSNASR